MSVTSPSWMDINAFSSGNNDDTKADYWESHPAYNYPFLQAEVKLRNYIYPKWFDLKIKDRVMSDLLRLDMSEGCWKPDTAHNNRYALSGIDRFICWVIFQVSHTSLHCVRVKLNAWFASETFESALAVNRFINAQRFLEDAQNVQGAERTKSDLPWHSSRCDDVSFLAWNSFARYVLLGNVISFL